MGFYKLNAFKKKQQRMPVATYRQIRFRGPESESGSVGETQEATGNEATPEAVMEDTQDATMDATQEDTTMEATQEDTTMRATQEDTEKSKNTVAVFKEEDEMKLLEFL